VIKRIPAFTLVVLSLTWFVPSQAQIYRGPNSAQEAQKAARKDQKRAAKRQRKANKKLRKAQRKAAKRAKHRS
jgi:ATPase subunit of ABC transporter with duplicated ATPase domains